MTSFRIIDITKNPASITVLEIGGGQHRFDFGDMVNLIEFAKRSDHDDDLQRMLAAALREIRKGDANLTGNHRNKTATVVETVMVV